MKNISFFIDFGLMTDLGLRAGCQRMTTYNGLYDRVNWHTEPKVQARAMESYSLTTEHSLSFLCKNRPIGGKTQCTKTSYIYGGNLL